jgi:dienelactone hydrolase
MMRQMPALHATALLVVCSLSAQAQGVTQREVHFYSEGVVCVGKLFLPDGYSEASKLPAVVLAPGSGKTGAFAEPYAEDLAMHGIVAMTFDYRGWGKSGGFLYFGEPVQWDDRLRFSETTTVMRVRRKRLEPMLQVTDIRNALTYIEGEPGVDRARLGVWGTDLSGGHAVVVAGMDARVKAIVSELPMLAGRGAVHGAFAPDPKQQAEMIKLARSGSVPSSARDAASRNTEESKLALAEYHPYWSLEQIAPTTAVRFIVAGADSDHSVEDDAVAASRMLKGPVDVARLPEAKHSMDQKVIASAVRAATEWFEKNL